MHFMKFENEALAARKKLNVNWSNAIFLIVAHAAAVAALFFWSWAAVITAVVLYWVGGSLGIGMGYHRLLTHRGYKCPKLVELARHSRFATSRTRSWHQAPSFQSGNLGVAACEWPRARAGCSNRPLKWFTELHN